MKERIIVKKSVKAFPVTVKFRGEDGMWHREKKSVDREILRFYLVLDNGDEQWLFDTEASDAVYRWFCRGRTELELQNFKKKFCDREKQLANAVANALRQIRYVRQELAA